MRQMRHVKPHSKAVCLLAPPCTHMVTARFKQSGRPRLNRLRIRRRRKKALAPCENTGKFPQKHSAKCVKIRTRAYNRKTSSRLSCAALFTRYFSRRKVRALCSADTKNTQNPLCASLFKAKTSAKLRLLVRQLNPPYGRRISPERQWFNANLGSRKSLCALSSGAKPGWTQNPFAIKFDPKSVWKLANKPIRHLENGHSPRQNAMPPGAFSRNSRPLYAR